MNHTSVFQHIHLLRFLFPTPHLTEPPHTRHTHFVADKDTDKKPSKMGKNKNLSVSLLKNAGESDAPPVGGAKSMNGGGDDDEVCREISGVFDKLGFGTYQKWLYLIASLIQVPSAMLNTGIAFIVQDPGEQARLRCSLAVDVFNCCTRARASNACFNVLANAHKLHTHTHTHTHSHWYMQHAQRFKSLGVRAKRTQSRQLQPHQRESRRRVAPRLQAGMLSVIGNVMFVSVSCTLCTHTHFYTYKLTEMDLTGLQQHDYRRRLAVQKHRSVGAVGMGPRVS
jgi:hypothetical protein